MSQDSVLRSHHSPQKNSKAYKNVLKYIGHSTFKWYHEKIIMNA